VFLFGHNHWFFVKSTQGVTLECRHSDERTWVFRVGVMLHLEIRKWYLKFIQVPLWLHLRVCRICEKAPLYRWFTSKTRVWASSSGIAAALVVIEFQDCVFSFIGRWALWVGPHASISSRKLSRTDALLLWILTSLHLRIQVALSRILVTVVYFVQQVWVVYAQHLILQ
jgi:hypothetical protein